MEEGEEGGGRSRKNWKGKVERREIEVYRNGGKEGSKHEGCEKKGRKEKRPIMEGGWRETRMLKKRKGWKLERFE